jgi:hypothetical protein
MVLEFPNADGCSESGLELMDVQLLRFATVGGGTHRTIAAGSASTPSMTAAADTNTGKFCPAADTIAYATGGSDIMRIYSTCRTKLLNISLVLNTFYLKLVVVFMQQITQIRKNGVNASA